MNEAEFAELVQRRPDLAHLFHYVRPGGHIKHGFFRSIPKTYRDREKRHPNLLRAEVAFGEAGQSIYGKCGLAKSGQPLVTDAIKKAMKGKQYRKPKWELAIEKLTAAMKEVVEVRTET